MIDAIFEVYKDKANKYRFRLRAPNNKIVTVGEAYESKSGCFNGVNAVKKYCGSEIEDMTKGEEKKPAPKFQVYKDRNDKFRFHLIAPNYEIVAVSEGYESRAGCLNGIKAVMNYCDSEIKDLTIKEMTKSPHLLEEIMLILDEPLSVAPAGSKVTFTGRLVEGEQGISDETIEIYESDRSFMMDDFLSSGKTDSKGYFSIDWLAKKMDWWDDSVEVYARFKEKGSRRLVPIHSKTYVMKIS
jgi:uncharacterized protein YegP (UPF0339 family)